MSQRPKWNYKIDEALAKWIWQNGVIKLTHHWEMTGADTSRDWVEMHSKDNGKRVAPHITSDTEARFQPDHRSLITLRPDISDTLFKIQQWEDSHKAKIKQFNELKQELGL